MTSLASPAPFFGRRVVAAAFVLAMFGWGLGFHGPPVFLQTVREERDWSVVLVSSAVTLHFLVGAVLLAAGILGWAVAQEPWQLLLATCLSHVVQIAGSPALLFGAGIGNTTSLPPLIAQVEFSKADVQRVVPLIVAIGQRTYAFAPAAFGGLRTLSPAEGMLVFVAAALIQTAAIALFLSGRRTSRLA
jgi:hypothetical protein